MTERRAREQALAASAGLANLQRLSGTDFEPGRTPEGRAWVASLPSLVRETADRWLLAAGPGEVRHGYNAVVLSVEHAGRPLALKLVWPPHLARTEAEALAAWQGNGIVELVRADSRSGALLLERLDASRPLANLPLAEAAAVAGGLIRTLAVEPPVLAGMAVPPWPPGLATTVAFPTTQDEARQLRVSLPRRQRTLGQPVPPDWIPLATDLATSLSANQHALLVHADLHYENVLASYRPGAPWIAVDPRARIGDPERSVPELLWTRADELDDAGAIRALLDQISDGGHLDRGRATAWGFVRTIDYWLWGLQHNLTEDPVRCERIADALVARCRRLLSMSSRRAAHLSRHSRRF